MKFTCRVMQRFLTLYNLCPIANLVDITVVPSRQKQRCSFFFQQMSFETLGRLCPATRLQTMYAIRQYEMHPLEELIRDYINKWHIHNLRMDPRSLTPKIKNYQPDGGRDTGRPRRRCEVEQDN
jgi:hypothetical protein